MLEKNSKFIYLDNAATSWPKPKCVKEKINQYFYDFPGSPNRSNYSSNIIDTLRQEIADYFDANEKNVVFVPSATIGMNIIFNSLLSTGDHILTTNCEHHCVYRTLEYLKDNCGIEYDIVQYIDCNQEEHIDRIFNSIKKNTKMIVMNHASNVTGTVFNVEKVGSYISNSEIIFVVDISQTCGYKDISIKNLHADIIVSSAHKHLFGIPGIGFLVFSKKVNFKPFLCGGTGKNSASMKQPLNMPEMLEPGTVNVPALLALQAGMKFCSQENRLKFQKHRQHLTNLFIKNCESIKSINLYFKYNNENTGILPFNISNLDPNFIVSPYLARNNIIIRSGLHCAPVIHKTIGTFPKGLNRASISIFNTEQDINILCEFIEQIGRGGFNDI